MPVVCKVFDKQGRWIDEIGGVFTRSWILNDEGKCQFEIALDDSKCKLSNLEFGNFIYITAKSIVTGTELPAWGGIIDTPRDWGDLQLTVNAYTAEHILKSRISQRSVKLRNDFGSLYRGLIVLANTTYPSLIKLGDSYSGDKEIPLNMNYGNIFKFIKEKLSDASLEEFSIDPAIDSSGRLSFEANWYKKKGTTRTFRLEEGHNIELNRNPLVEDGTIINHQFGAGKGQTLEDREASEYNEKDATSIARYGPRMEYEQFTDRDIQRGVIYEIQTKIAKSKNPRRTFRVSALDKGETFANIALGDTIPIKYTTVGWNADGTRGVSTNVRVKGIAYRDDQQKMELTLDEVI